MTSRVPLLALLLTVGCSDGASPVFDEPLDSGTTGDDATADGASLGDGASVGDGAAADDAAANSDTTSMSDSPTGDAGPGSEAGTKKCDAKKADCAATEYCDAVGCGVGECKPRPAAVALAYAPVCGCNGVSYWNDSQAWASGATVASTGACTTTAIACAAFSMPCAAPANKCVNERSSCSGVSTSGTCWFVPSGGTCPAAAKDVRQCTFTGGGTCMSRCDAIRGDRGFAADATCK
jgi:hypothetical protein